MCLVKGKWLKNITLFSTLLMLLAGCSTETYVSQENVDKFQDPLVRKFYIQECLAPRPNIEVAVAEHFDFDKSELKLDDHAAIDSLIEKIKGKHGQIAIMGHTDSQGSNTYNERLSLRRAQSIQAYMAQKLVSENYNWELKYFGETKPVVKERSLSAYAQNRRAFIVFEEKQIHKDNPICDPPKPKRKVAIAMTSHFDFDKAILKPLDKESLDEFVDNIKNVKGRILVTGNTDHIGSESYNAALSKRRAAAVIQYLQAKLPPENFLWQMVPRGELDMITEERTLEANALNRRAFVIFKEGDVPAPKTKTDAGGNNKVDKP